MSFRVQNSFVFSFLILVFFSCKNEKSYQQSDKGFEYMILSKNPKGTQIKKGDIISLNLKYYNHSDSLLFDSDELPAKFRVQIGNSNTDGILQDALRMLKTGDSASFLIPAADFYLKTKRDSIPNFILSDEWLRFELKPVDIVSEHQLKKEFEQFMLKKEAEENHILNAYLSAENIKQKPEVSGIYIIRLKKGHGKKAVSGKKVTIQFIGRFINGKIFDSSLDKDKPLTFILGDKEIIPAWNEAIASMREGDKIRLIAPSKTAYGQEGLKNYVPPFTSLIYEIKLLNVE